MNIKTSLLALSSVLIISNTYAQSKKSVNYGRNILAVAPLQVTNDVGVGLSYERVLDKKGILSFYMPFAISLNNNTGTNNTINPPQNNNGSRFYAMPGLKLYPGGFGKIRYAVGPNLVYATGKEEGPWNILDNNGNVIGQQRNLTRTMIGIMATNSLNINPTEHIYLSAEFGLGFTYLNKIGSLKDNTAAMAQAGFKIGYRF